MARKRKTDDEKFFDVFADMDYEEQEIALRILALNHRQTRRIEAKKGRPALAATASPTPLLDAAAGVKS